MRSNKDTGIFIPGLTSMRISSESQLEEYLQLTARNHSIMTTNMSRSESTNIYQLTLENIPNKYNPHRSTIIQFVICAGFFQYILNYF